MRSIPIPPALKRRSEDLVAAIAALVIGGVAMDSTDVATSAYADTNDLIGLAAVALVWWRRRAPVPIAVVAIVAAGAAPLAHGASVVGLYTVAAMRPIRTSALVAALQAVSMVVSATVFPDPTVGVPWSILAGLLITMVAWGWGSFSKSRRELMESMAERAERAEAEQRARVAEVRRMERARIAAEMHDVLAHRLSMLSLQAGAIETRPDAPAGQLVEAARVVRASAHLALEELRSVLNVLRHDGGPPDQALQPGAAELEALVDECRRAGMRITLDWNGVDPAKLPDQLGRHLYRTVQEGLTNARKHARGQPVALSLTGRPGSSLSVSIINPTGAGASSITAATGRTAGTEVDTSSRSAPTPGAGLGLVGVRERVQLAGGQMGSGLDEAGVHRLEVSLPWPP
jgi:signal transduction histidine kinase